jgi:hypothetical protein
MAPTRNALFARMVAVARETSIVILLCCLTISSSAASEARWHEKAGLPTQSEKLKALGHEVLVANSRKLRFIYQSRFGLALEARGGKHAKKRAVVAVARKLAMLLHRLWRSGEVYEPSRHLAAERVNESETDSFGI